jgi:hypothetical protein
MTRRHSAQGEGAAMTLSDDSIAAFALLNGGEAVAYVPWIIRIHRDPSGATSEMITSIHR